MMRQIRSCKVQSDDETSSPEMMDQEPDMENFDAPTLKIHELLDIAQRYPNATFIVYHKYFMVENISGFLLPFFRKKC